MSLFKSAAKAGLQSASIMALSDIAIQLGVEGKAIGTDRALEEKENTYDPMRTARWATLGLTLHGPYFFLACNRVDHIFGLSRSMPVVLKKTASVVSLVFPPYTVGLFAYMAAMEGLSDGTGTANVASKVREKAPKALLTGGVYWSVANCVNFALIPPSRRVAYLAGVGAIWNGYLSYMNEAKQEDEASKALLPGCGEMHYCTAGSED